MALDLSSLRRAIHAADEARQVATDAPFLAGLSQAQRNTIRAGMIQHFEFVYELCWKFIQRWIRANVSPDAADPRTRRDLFRLGAAHGLIADPQPWFEYSAARNITSHTYDDSQAEAVFAVAIRMVDDAHDFLVRLERVNE